MITIQESAIHGKGLFAAQDIPQGTIIGKIVGSPTIEDGPHVIWLSEEIGFHVENEMKYINHSATPNAAYYDDGEVIALRLIDKGEEITHDYDGDGLDWQT